VGLRKILQLEITPPSSRVDGLIRVVFEAVGLLVLMVSVIIFLPPVIGAILLLITGAVIVIRQKTYLGYGPLVQGRPAIFIGSTFLVVGGVLAAYAILIA
jgi:hypothetical protein